MISTNAVLFLLFVRLAILAYLSYLFYKILTKKSSSNIEVSPLKDKEAARVKTSTVINMIDLQTKKPYPISVLTGDDQKIKADKIIEKMKSLGLENDYEVIEGIPTDKV